MNRNELTKAELEILTRPMTTDTSIDLYSQSSPTTSFPEVAATDKDAITEPQLAGLHKLHQPVAVRAESLISNEAGLPIHVTLSSVELSTYAEFVFGRPIPSGFAKLHCRPHSSFWVMDIEYDILFALIDCLLGGPSKDAEKVQRPLTEIERRLTKRVMQPWLTAIEEA